MKQRAVRRLAAVLAGLVSLALPAAAAEAYHVPQARVPLLSTAPTIDGEVRAEEWAGALRMERFCGVREPLLTGGEASFWVGCDGTKLYIAVVSETAPGGQLLQRVVPAPQDGDARVWLDDSVELVLDPLRAETGDRRRLYHAILNARGAIYDQRHALTGGGEAWRGHWELASKVIGERWHMEIALPLADLGVAAADLKGPFGVRVCRNWMRTAGPEQSEWSAVGGAFLSPETLPVICWDAAAPVVQTLQLVDPGTAQPRVRVSIGNPGPASLAVQAAIVVRPRSSAPAETRQALTLAPGGSKVLELGSGLAPGDPAYTLIEVTSPDGRQIYYQRDFQWRLDRPEPFFAADQGEARRVGLDIAYYPYHNVMQVRVEVSGLQEKEKVTGVGLSVRAKADGRLVAETGMPALRESRTELDWVLPPLAEGTYELVARLAGVTTDPVSRTFVRHVFPWEHNRIGRSDILIPPYTPIRVDGNRVSTVLRTHTVSPVGLWEQVESLATPLLRGPMRLEAKVAGQTVLASGTGLAYSETGDTRAVAAGSWSAAPLRGRVQTQWDFDGAMTWVLELEPTATPVEALTLTVPLDAALCSLMHACTDGIRFNYAGLVPAGEGRVWEGGKAARNSIIGSYVPYLWVGEEERGLCVYGENDRGWVTDPGVPCQELVRHGDTLDLVLHLIARPGVVEAPRRLTVTFQATPVKPMPADWRRWVFGAYRAAAFPDIRYLAFLGSCWYWGTDTPCLDWYPRGGDMTYLRKLAETRRTGVVDTAYIEQWLKGFEAHYAAAKTPEKRKEVEDTFRAHTNAAFHTMKGKPQFVNFYTNGRGVRFDTPEGQTFLDEWYREAFATRDWPFCGGVAYDLDPVESFRDYALWYLRQMADTVLDSVYWDDLFLQSNFDTVGTDAYRLPSGFTQPSMGLFNLREFVRRTARMYLELGRPPQNIVHMTNTAIVPVLSFAQMNYTWEDKAGAADFQDRFSRDYIRAESLGLQQGNVPFALWLVQADTPEKLAWVERTGTGVMLVHEIKTSDGGDLFWKIYHDLLDFGYGKPDVAVSQYWKKGHPARVEGSDAVTLVLSRAGSALVLVCDYGEGGDLVLRLERAALGLPERGVARNVETGQALELAADGAIRFSLRKHDFRLILVAGETP